MQERQAQGGQDRRGPEVALDPVEDRGEPDELAGRVQREQLVDERLGAIDRGEARPRSAARTSSTPTSARARTRSSSSSGPWRLLRPPRWSRQTVQR